MPRRWTAGRVIAAFEEAETEGRGVVTVDGRMVENLHVDQARRTLTIQAAIAALEGPEGAVALGPRLLPVACRGGRCLGGSEQLRGHLVVGVAEGVVG